MKKESLSLGKINEFRKFITGRRNMTKCVACDKKTANHTSRRIGRYRICDSCWEIGYRFKNVWAITKGDLMSTGNLVLYRNLDATSIVIKEL